MNDPQNQNTQNSPGSFFAGMLMGGGIISAEFNTLGIEAGAILIGLIFLGMIARTRSVSPTGLAAGAVSSAALNLGLTALLGGTDPIL